MLLFLLAQALACWAKVPVVAVSELRPQEQQVRVAETIVHIIDTHHYKAKPLDDSLSEVILNNYLDNLDPNRSFFTQQDIATFDRFRHTLDDALRIPDLAAAFQIFLRFRERVDQRIALAKVLLETGFDFEVDETYQFDRRKAPWAANEAEIRELWRKRVKNDALGLKVAGKEDKEMLETLGKRYERIRTSTFQINANDVFQSFMNAYTTAIEPHTAYFSPRTSENFDISMRLSLEGIGAVLSGENDYTQVQRVIPGGPADLSGQLHPEDRIVGVGQDDTGEIVDVIGWRLDDVVDLIRGPKGSVVRLDVLPAGAGAEVPSRTIRLTRDEIRLEEQAARSEIVDLPDAGRVGVIVVPTFYSDFAAQARGERDYKSTTRDVRRLISELKQENLDGLIVDLRGNGGGSLSEALELTGLFIESGPIVQTRDANGRIDVNRDPDPGIAYGGPLAVLVDRDSASASEIFAGAIQDYRRGIIIGEPTFGKGTVQNIVDLNRYIGEASSDYGRLKTTIAQFYRISGGSNQHKGVIPDVVFPTAETAKDYGERSLDNALPWDQVEPARFVPASAPIDSFVEVRRRHVERLKQDRLFQLLLEEVHFDEQASERTTVSLNLVERKAERDRLLDERKRLRNEMRRLQGLPPLPDESDADDDTESVTDAGADEESEEADVLLTESARILVDLIVPGRRTAANVPGTKPAPVN
ncbi:MAG TPA: carboxy terminal-processing peptidase [Gammaproteobacteria bacterium]